MNRIIRNAIQTPDGTILESTRTHDYKTHMDSITKEKYVVDGGGQYLRRSVNKVPYIELSLYEDGDIEKIRQIFSWGTFGKDGKQSLKKKLLCDMPDDHIEAIINDGIYKWNDLMGRELEYRKLNNIRIDNEL
jgi:hypothetical protein